MRNSKSAIGRVRGKKSARESPWLHETFVPSLSVTRGKRQFNRRETPSGNPVICASSPEDVCARADDDLMTHNQRQMFADTSCDARTSLLGIPACATERSFAHAKGTFAQAPCRCEIFARVSRVHARRITPGDALERSYIHRGTRRHTRTCRKTEPRSPAPSPALLATPLLVTEAKEQYKLVSPMAGYCHRRAVN